MGRLNFNLRNEQVNFHQQKICKAFLFTCSGDSLPPDVSRIHGAVGYPPPQATEIPDVKSSSLEYRLFLFILLHAKQAFYH